MIPVFLEIHRPVLLGVFVVHALVAAMRRSLDFSESKGDRE